MTTKQHVSSFIKSQKSLQFYFKIQKALADVLLRLSNEEYSKITKNLEIMAIHEGALGQVMHFSNLKGKYKVLQLTFPKNIPLPVLRFVLAHELGHVAQGRNWRKADGSHLETDADLRAKKWGFNKTKPIAAWMKNYGAKYGEKF